METKFQTSFIPKKPLPVVGVQGANVGISSHKVAHSGSLFLNISILLFVISLGAGGGVYAWKTYQLSNQEYYKQQLVERQKQFNPELIQQLKLMNTKIDNAKQLLSKHMALSNIFGIISQLTIENVRFLSMDVSTVNKEEGNAGDIRVSLSGYGTNLSAVAFQAKVLSELEKYNLRNIVKNPVVSEPELDTGGAVSFDIKAVVDPSTIIYMKGASNSAEASSTGNI